MNNYAGAIKAKQNSLTGPYLQFENCGSPARQGSTPQSE